jgi:hypothetical protein
MDSRGFGGSDKMRTWDIVRYSIQTALQPEFDRFSKKQYDFRGASQSTKKKQRLLHQTCIRKATKLCLNCLYESHINLKECTSKIRCKYCSKAHNFSFHLEISEEMSKNQTVVSMSVSMSPSTTLVPAIHHSNSLGSFSQPYIFLKTAVFYARFKGFKERAYILIDEGSQSIFITLLLAKLLRLKQFFRQNFLFSGFSTNPKYFSRRHDIRLVKCSY